MDKMKFQLAPAFGRLAQLVRVLCSHRRGHPFESDIAHIKFIFAGGCA